MRRLEALFEIHVDILLGQRVGDLRGALGIHGGILQVDDAGVRDGRDGRSAADTSDGGIVALFASPGRQARARLLVVADEETRIFIERQGIDHLLGKAPALEELILRLEELVIENGVGGRSGVDGDIADRRAVDLDAGGGDIGAHHRLRIIEAQQQRACQDGKDQPAVPPNHAPQVKEGRGERCVPRRRSIDTQGKRRADAAARPAGAHRGRKSVHAPLSLSTGSG